MKKRHLLPQWSYLPLTLVFWVGLWQLIALLFDKPLLRPTPVAVVKTLITLGGTEAFWLTVALSLLRILAGIALALIAGLLLAILTVKSPLWIFG